MKISKSTRKKIETAARFNLCEIKKLRKYINGWYLIAAEWPSYKEEFSAPNLDTLLKNMFTLSENARRRAWRKAP